MEKVYIPKVKKTSVFYIFITILIIGLILYIFIAKSTLSKISIAFIIIFIETAILVSSLYKVKFIIHNDTFTLERYFYKKKIKEESINIKDIYKINYERYRAKLSNSNTYSYRYVFYTKDKKIEIESGFITDNVKILFQDLKKINPDIAFIDLPM